MAKLRKTLFTLVFSLSLALPFNSSNVNVDKLIKEYTLNEKYRELSDDSDQKIARYLAKKSKDGNEYVVFYIPEKDYLVDLTRKTKDSLDMMRTYVNEPLAISLLNQNSHIIIAHSHPQSYDNFLKYFEKSLKDFPEQKEDAISEFKMVGEEEINNRLMNEIPGIFMQDSIIKGDIATMLNTTLYAFSNNPDSEIEQRIVILRENENSQVINYGFTRSVLEQLRKSTPKIDKTVYPILQGKNMLTGIMSSDSVLPDSTINQGVALLREYFSIIAEYDSTHCDLAQIGDCKPRNTNELVDLINKSGHFFVKDRGKIDIKK